MKKLLLYTFLLLLTTAAFAQKKPNDKYFKVSLTEKRYPLKPLPKEVKKYKVNVSGSSRLDVEMLRVKYFKFDALQKDDASPDVTLRVKLSGMRHTTEISRSEKKRKDGSKYYYYGLTAKYHYTVQYSVILNKTDEVIDEQEFVKEDSDWVTGGYTPKEVKKDWKNMRSKHLYKIEKKLLKKMLPKIQDRFKSNFLISNITRPIVLGNVKGKGERLPDAKQAFDMAKTAIATYSKEGKKDAEGKLNEAIGVWEKALEEADLKKKKARVNYRIARMLNYNCALAYYLLDDFVNCQKYIDACVQLKGIRRRAKKLKRWAEDKEKRFKVNGLQ